MAEKQHISHVSIKLDGAPVSEEVIHHLVEVTVENSLHLPSMFTIRLTSPDMKWLEDETFREGKKVEILAGEPPLELISGKIAGLEPELDQTNPMLVVRGYDLSHKLYRGKRRRSFNNVTDADLARKLAQESGLRPGKIDDAPGAPHEYVYQNNQTNAEFLLERARRLGYELFVDGDALHFRKPAADGKPVALAWGESLRSFSARLSTAAQVNEVEVRGWDSRKKEKIEGHASHGNGAPKIGIPQAGADIARNTWGEAKIAIVDQFVRSPSEAEMLAQAALDELASSFVEADGVCDGSPDVLPGRMVEIKGVGKRFEGQYYVTQVLHEWAQEQGLFTHFVASGRRDQGVWSLLEDRPAARQMGPVIGVVTNNKDPDDLGRVRVRFPWLSDQDESAWARVVSPMAGSGRGLLILPEVDDEVMLVFEHGDIHRPFVVGALWNQKDALPLKTDQVVGGDGKVNKRILKSRSGHIVLLDDTPGGEEITIVDKTGSNKIVLHSPDNSLQIKVTGNLTIEAQGKVEIKGNAGVEMTSGTTLKVKGDSGVEMTSGASLMVKGMTSTVEGTTSLTVKDGAGAQVALSGPSVNVNDGALEVT